MAEGYNGYRGSHRGQLHYWRDRIIRHGSQFSVVVSSAAGGATSNAATLTVNAATDVLTYHNDNARTGQNLTDHAGLLCAYNATNLNEVYCSNLAGSRDQFVGNKFVTPMIANGKVFVGTPTGMAVFGLLPQ